MKKYKLGQFFTQENYWMQPQILRFIGKHNFNLLIDPFAGNGDLLEQFNKKVKKINTLGYDIDKSLNSKWKINDSLIKIEHIPKSFIITNPPYLSKSSSKRKNINHEAFFHSNRSDLYQIALDSMLNSKMPGIAIVPESFMNSKYDKKHVYSITVLIPNPFEDTDVPVCVICFDPNENFEETRIYKNKTFLGNLNEIKNKANNLLKKNNEIVIFFNDESGKLALVAYDSFSGKKIRFLKSENLNYDRPQKISSRAITKIKTNKYISNAFINKLNKKLNVYRQISNDILLTPFRNNNIKNERRRRLDYITARKMINSLEI